MVMLTNTSTVSHCQGESNPTGTRALGNLRMSAQSDKQESTKHALKPGRILSNMPALGEATTVPRKVRGVHAKLRSASTTTLSSHVRVHGMTIFKYMFSRSVTLALCCNMGVFAPRPKRFRFQQLAKQITPGEYVCELKNWLDKSDILTIEDILTLGGNRFFGAVEEVDKQIGLAKYLLRHNEDDLYEVSVLFPQELADDPEELADEIKRVIECRKTHLRSFRKALKNGEAGVYKSTGSWWDEDNKEDRIIHEGDVKKLIAALQPYVIEAKELPDTPAAAKRGNQRKRAGRYQQFSKGNQFDMTAYSMAANNDACAASKEKVPNKSRWKSLDEILGGGKMPEKPPSEQTYKPEGLFEE